MAHWAALILVSCAAAVVLHELAHVVVARLLGLKVKSVGISWKGAYIVRESGTPGVNACVALAGPILNLSLAILFQGLLPRFAEINLLLGCFNLLPIPSSDGYRVLCCWKESMRARRTNVQSTRSEFGIRRSMTFK